MTGNASRSLFMLILSVAVFVALAAVALALAPRLFLLFDEAYNLSVSKTLAQQGLYASRLGDWYRVFDPEVTTGPTLLAPLAAAIRLGGATFATVRLAMVVVFLFCFGAFYGGARQFVGPVPALAFVVVTAGLPLVLEYGLCVLGDVPAAALGVAGLGLLRRAEDQQPSRRPLLLLLLSGLAWGLAMLSKDMMALLLVAVALAWLSDRRARREDGRRRLALLMPLLIATALAGGWRLLQAWFLGRWPDAEALAYYRQAAAAMAERTWHEVAFAPLSHSGAALASTLDYYLPLLATLALAAAGYIVLRRRGGAPWLASRSLAERSVAAGGLLWLLWYIVLSGPQTYNHHVLPGIILLALLVIMLLGRLALQAADQRLLALVLSLSLLWCLGHGAGYLRLYLLSSERRVAMQQTAAQWLRSNTPAEANAGGWGWFVPWHVAFMADRLPVRVDPWVASPASGPVWFVLSPEIIWGGALDAPLQEFLARQGAPVVDQPLYPVYRVQSQSQ